MRTNKTVPVVKESLTAANRAKKPQSTDKYGECPKCGADCIVTRGSDPFTFHYVPVAQTVEHGPVVTATFQPTPEVAGSIPAGDAP